MTPTLRKSLHARRLQIAHAGHPVTIKSPAEIAATFALGQVDRHQ